MLQALPPKMTEAPLFTDHAVIQRDVKVPVFGTDIPGQTVTVRLDRLRRTTNAGPDGKWQVEFPSLRTKLPIELTIQGSRTIVAKDLVVGEVWIASGQSNMEWTMGMRNNLSEQRARPNPNIRTFTVAKNAAMEPTTMVDGSWMAASTANIDTFSAVAYAFADSIQQRVGVPVGIIHTSWGGTPVEAWTSIQALNSTAIAEKQSQQYSTVTQTYPAAIEKYKTDVVAYQKARFPELDEPGEYALWAKPDLALTPEWQDVTVPHVWAPDFDGIAWYRLTVDLTAEEAAKEQKLILGPIDDMDITYVNGVQVGRTDMTSPNHYAVNREYTVPTSVLKAGENVIAIRAIDGWAGGGVGSPTQPMSFAGHPLKEAKLRIERQYKNATNPFGDGPQAPIGPGNPWLPSSLYNGMINPLIPYAIRGAIWYQGESNADRAEQYRTLFPLMITDWRKRWGQGDFPFYWVNLASYMTRKPSGEDSAWAELREAQTMTLRLPNTGQALAIDLGEEKDIHPMRKKEVGERLALHALQDVYGFRSIIANGPMVARIRVKNDKMLVDYPSYNALRTSDRKDPVGFSVAGADGKFVPATAKIIGSTIEVSSPKVKEPMYVRYAWADNPAVNLTGPTGLPAVPFRSDRLPLTTDGKR